MPFPDPIPVRVQSSCLFSESLLAKDCDCASQLHESLKIIAREGGIVIYLYEEGRGAGLKHKIAAISLQQRHHIDTGTAFSMLSLPSDLRDHSMAAKILNTIVPGCRIDLLTNNPRKMELLQSCGVHVVRKRPLICCTTPEVAKYLEEKVRVLQHEIPDDKILAS